MIEICLNLDSDTIGGEVFETVEGEGRYVYHKYLPVMIKTQMSNPGPSLPVFLFV